jgi:AraC family transcriptional activator of pobA
LPGDYFEKEVSLNKGLPTVEFQAESLNLSPRCLSDMLRSLTGQRAQQHIHVKLIDLEFSAGTSLPTSLRPHA